MDITETPDIAWRYVEHGGDLKAEQDQTVLHSVTEEIADYAAYYINFWECWNGDTKLFPWAMGGGTTGTPLNIKCHGEPDFLRAITDPPASINLQKAGRLFIEDFNRCAQSWAKRIVEDWAEEHFHG